MVGERSSLAKSPARERSRGDASDIDGQTERSNGVFGKSDIEGKVARVAARKRGRDRVSNERERASQSIRELDIERWAISALVSSPLIRAGRRGAFAKAG